MERRYRVASAIFKNFRSVIDLILKPVYKAYELWLWSQISEGPKPKHVAIIPDGNRRWAKYLGKQAIFGHEVGYEKLKEVLEWLWDLGIKAVTIYAMSYENCVKRPPEEKQHLFDLLRKGIRELIEGDEVRRRGIKVKFIGRLDIVPEELVNEMRRLEDLSKTYTDHYLNIAVCYGGRQEIVTAVRELVNDALKGKLSVESIDEDTFRKYLGTSHMDIDGVSDPDLVIRTSGELRVSNFLLWQIAYSELYFCEAYWPEFRKIDLWRAVRSYQQRERRFGK